MMGWDILLQGMVLGLWAGISPGPLFALVISESLEHGTAAGLKVAVSPLLTDLPIIIVSVAVLNKVSDIDAVMGAVSAAGAVLLLMMGVKTLSRPQEAASLESGSSNALVKGILINAISPHPYLFWITVGAPFTLKAMDRSALTAAGFILGFYVFLVGSKMGLAIIVGRIRTFLATKAYRILLKGLGVILIGFSFLLFKEAIVFFF